MKGLGDHDYGVRSGLAGRLRYTAVKSVPPPGVEALH